MVSLPTSAIHKLHVVLFQQSQCYYLEKFSAIREWCVNAEEAIVSIMQKGLVTGLIRKMEEINSEAFLFVRKVPVQLPSFVTARVSATRPDLHPK